MPSVFAGECEGAAPLRVESKACKGGKKLWKSL
jgi:hypothetical protein